MTELDEVVGLFFCGLAYAVGLLTEMLLTEGSVMSLLLNRL